MSVHRRLFAFLLAGVVAVAAAAALASCGGDGDDGDDIEVTLLPQGEYPATVSGSIEFTLTEPAVSAVAFGDPQQIIAEVSGTATLNLGTDGSFEIPEFGISGTFSEGGQTQTIENLDRRVVLLVG